MTDPRDGMGSEPLASLCLMMQTLSASAGGLVIQAPVGGSGGGTTSDFGWLWDLRFLSNMTARFEWSSTDPTAEELEIEAYVFDDNRPWYEQPAASGPSPLQIAVNFTGPKLDVQPHFEFGPARNGALPVYAAKTVVDQKVSITIYETYHCSASVHPDGIKPSA